MGRSREIWSALLGVALLAAATAAWATPYRAGYAGDVLGVDRAAGTIVVGDMGPLRSTGTSEIARRTIQVTPATEFVLVARAMGAAPTGWIGDYVETALPPWQVKPGDFVSITMSSDTARPEAVKVMVVEQEKGR